ncbi:hypothetical protein GGF46_001064 [Coemansia sp. RSA 552]|nr:hypothetical protein GGF46_001064 [Coemansia sp. RSA 552]
MPTYFRPGRSTETKGAAGGSIRVDSAVPSQPYFIGGVQVQFPFRPYPSQFAMMCHMIRAFNAASNTMIESATGSGKSLALLCATIAWRRDFANKAKQQRANVAQIIRAFCQHNHELLQVKFGDMDSGPPPSQTAKQPEADGKRERPEADGSVVPMSPPSSDSDVTMNPAPGATPHPDSPVELASEAKGTPNSDTPVPSSILDHDDDDDDDDDFVEAKPSTRNPKSAPKTAASAQTPHSAERNLPEILQARALATLVETAEYILHLAKARVPAGVTAEDLTELQKLVDAGPDGVAVPRIYFGSRTHKQVSQLVSELRRKTPYRLKTAVLGSRSQTCINTHAKREARKGVPIDETCRKLVDDEGCAPQLGYRRILENMSLAAGGDNEIWDIEDIVNIGKKRCACPYYATRDLAASADLVFAPYNYLLDPQVRDATGIDLNGSIVILDEAHNIENAARDAGSFDVTDLHLLGLAKECVNMINRSVLVPEHRVINTLAESLAFWLQSQDNTYEYRDYEVQTSVWPKSDCSITNVLQELALTPEIVEAIEEALTTIQDYIKSVRASKDSGTRQAKVPRVANESHGAIDEPGYLGPGMIRTVEGLVRMLKYVAPDSQFYGDYRVAITRSPNPELSEAARGGRRRQKQGQRSLAESRDIPSHINTLSFWAQSPGVVFAEIAAKSRSIVLTSGTLSPLDSYASELRVEFVSKLEAEHVIDPQRFMAMAIRCGPLRSQLEAKYQTTDQLSFQDDMGMAIQQIIARCPDGMLVFAPSYALLNKLFGRWEATGVLAEMSASKEVFVEPQGGTKEDFDKFLAQYRKALHKDGSGEPAQRGAVMFAVYRGKASEGIDFSDSYCRTVINLGIPYPAFKDVKVMLKREYNDMHSAPGPGVASSQILLSGSKWYDIQAFRATNQALGRCLRHKQDWGAIIMLEARFTHPWNISRLSKWVRGHIRTYDHFESAMENLASFYDMRIQDDIVAAAEDELLDGI